MCRSLGLSALYVTGVLALGGGTALAQDTLPRPDQPFKGVIGRTANDSTPDFPKPIEAPKDAPNILLVLTDDAGFGTSSAFGGPIPMPTMDRLAQSGLRFTNFHTTALCSPTRAALITGRNHHSVQTGVITEFATGYPGYNSVMSKENGTVAQVLQDYGYTTSWYGKNHNVPDWQTSQAGPFDLWPTGLGFSYFYGFIGGDTDQWRPALFEGTKPIEPYAGKPDYILDVDLADHAIDWIRMQKSVAPQKPFLAYYATGTSHAPHHAPKDWIARFKGKFDQGWDRVREETFARQKQMGVIPENAKLTPRPAELPAWDSLSADQKRLYARMAETYAGALSHADYNIGRVIDAIDELGELDNTLIIYINGDNGCSGEGTLQGTSNEVAVNANGVTEDLPYLLSMIDELGGPKTYNHMPAAWAWAFDTPFQWTKQVASHFGGTRNGLVISWPDRIKAGGGIRTQFHHVIDIVPTIYEVLGINPPAMLNGVAQKPIEGVSMVYAFDDAAAPSTHKTQYFEMLGNRALYSNGWIASTTPKRLPWQPKAVPGADDPLTFNWELYHVAQDFSQADNLAKQNPEKLRELQDLFWAEGARYNVLPLDASFAERVDPAIRPSLTRGRNVFTYYPGMIRIPEGSTPDIKNRSYSVSADVEISQNGSDGVLATQGGDFGGWGLLVIDRKPMFVHALSNQPQHKFKVASTEQLPPGKHVIRFEFTYDGGGIGKGGNGKLLVDGKQVAQAHIDRTICCRFSLDETFDVGADTGSAVIPDYENRMPFEFAGKLEKVTIELQ
ncbi:arylsulfatase [Rhizobium sp. P32RR-XVIII]|uniref:arylsulfatase n=1 Tax=Rhizobium sp. P32RR-XVIII TaxID=2726738 RepID=UPI001456FAD2|nr:arylsulfatase [Rhizobium sp. P32RR-XVIII]NLS02733.1 arylsulfatase [Rhizobium sp. P32RR-XVIII]